MIGGFQNIPKIPELRKRIIISLLLLAVYRIGVHIPTPGIDGAALAGFFARAKGTLFGFMDMFSGGALENMSVFKNSRYVFWRCTGTAFGVRPGHYALHKLFHYFAASDHGDSLP